MKETSSKNEHHRKKVPLWKWIVILLLVIALPLLFTFSSNIQIKQVLATEPNK